MHQQTQRGNGLVCDLAHSRTINDYVRTYVRQYVHIYLRTRTDTHSYVCTHASDAQISFYKNACWPVALVMTQLPSELSDITYVW